MIINRLIRRLQAVMKKFSRDLRNKALITSFHDTCKTATSSMIPLLRQTLSANPQVYRNKWSSYCTFYQSLLLGGRSEVLTGFTITPKLILEKDIDGATLLPYAVSNPNMAFLKTLAKIITDVKSSDATMPDDDEGEDEAEDRGSIVSPTSPALIDVFTGLTIIKAGWVKKLGSKFGFKYYKKRYAVLTEEYIVFYRAVNKRPAGCIPIDGAVITRLSGSEPIISIKLPDSTVVDKKKQLKHTVYTLKLENEADVQDWQTPMKLAAGVRPFRETPINYINLNIRAAWCELVDKRGRTALHALAAISSDLHLAKEEEAIMTAAWLLENGCSVEARDVDKRTPIIVALDSKFSALQAFLLRRKQSIDALDPRNPSRISISALGLAQLESRKSIVKEPHQLLQTMKLKGFSYLQIYIQKFRQVIPR